MLSKLLYIFDLVAAGSWLPRNIVTIVVNILLLVAVLIINAYKTAAESQDLAEGDKYAVVYLRQRRQNEARREHRASKDA